MKIFKLETETLINNKIWKEMKNEKWKIIKRMILNLIN